MAKKTSQPAGDQLFTAQDYQQLVAHRNKLGNMIGTLDKAAACGIACDFIRAQRDEVDQQLAAIQQHFMTPAPTAQ